MAHSSGVSVHDVAQKFAACTDGRPIEVQYLADQVTDQPISRAKTSLTNGVGSIMQAMHPKSVPAQL